MSRFTPRVGGGPAFLLNVCAHDFTYTIFSLYSPFFYWLAVVPRPIRQCASFCQTILEGLSRLLVTRTAASHWSQKMAGAPLWSPLTAKFGWLRSEFSIRF